MSWAVVTSCVGYVMVLLPHVWVAKAILVLQLNHISSGCGQAPLYGLLRWHNLLLEELC